MSGLSGGFVGSSNAGNPARFTAACLSFRLGGKCEEARSTWSLIAIAVVVLVGFALFVLRTEAIERTRDVETAKRAR
jgi:hypothetical protein